MSFLANQFGLSQDYQWGLQAQRQAQYQQLMNALMGARIYRGESAPSWHKETADYYKKHMANMPEGHNCELVLWEDNGEIKTVVRPREKKENE